MADKNLAEGPLAKIFVGVATAVLSAFILYKLGLKETKPENPPKPTPIEQSKLLEKPEPAPSSEVINPASQSKAPDRPKPPTTFAPEPSLPATSCPAVQGMFWMQYPNAWYGPFSGGDAIQYSSAGGFLVYNGQMLNVFNRMGSVVPYPDPGFQYPRNIWIPLQQSRFSVCIDGAGQVFGWTPQ